MNTFLHCWDGRYVGFISGRNVFDRDSKYLGWVEEDGDVWTADGVYWGEIVDEKYILKQRGIGSKGRRGRKGKPATPGRPGTPAKLASRARRAGWDDALEHL